MHEVLVNRLGGLSLPRKSVVRLTDRPDMTLDVYRGRKTTMQQQQRLQYTGTFNTRISCYLCIILNVTQGLMIFSMQMDLDPNMRVNYICADFVLITSTRLRNTLGSSYDSAALIRDLFHFVNTNTHLGQM